MDMLTSMMTTKKIMTRPTTRAVYASDITGA
jgi:hypothetical protein